MKLRYSPSAPKPNSNKCTLVFGGMLSSTRQEEVIAVIDKACERFVATGVDSRYTPYARSSFGFLELLSSQKMWDFVNRIKGKEL